MALSIGILRKRLPVAAKIALATAGTMADVPARPSFRRLEKSRSHPLQPRRSDENPCRQNRAPGVIAPLCPRMIEGN